MHGCGIRFEIICFFTLLIFSFVSYRPWFFVLTLAFQVLYIFLAGYLASLALMGYFSSNGFGFTVTGRETAKGERLFHIGTVKPYGVALEHLKSGDRLLEINEESTGNLRQLEIVDQLKKAKMGKIQLKM
ncbi:unnamed protein product [Caenorhabditis angaria]|uniref:PDZ domain-containing protein n=1 Tax=Caenorhabditis angaria TaxID=860376 RepID=A0A9P1N3A4_9PELO|nr:unnamed protein product [Caenorhabditis angaria]